MEENSLTVNSWNEWDPLKHVIVGRADNCCIPPAEPATDPKIPEDSDMKGMHGPRTQESIDKGNVQLDGLASILEKRGIQVCILLLFFCFEEMKKTSSYDTTVFCSEYQARGAPVCHIQFFLYNPFDKPVRGRTRFLCLHTSEFFHDRAGELRCWEYSYELIHRQSFHLR